MVLDFLADCWVMSERWREVNGNTPRGLLLAGLECVWSKRGSEAFIVTYIPLLVNNAHDCDFPLHDLE